LEKQITDLESDLVQVSADKAKVIDVYEKQVAEL
jgi:hypothetical protein